MVSDQALDGLYAKPKSVGDPTEGITLVPVIYCLFVIIEF